MESSKLNTRLLQAVHSGNLRMAEKWLKKGGEINQVNNENYSLILAAIYNDDQEMLFFLLKNGIDVNINREGYGAVHGASAVGNLKMLKILTEKGLDLGLREESDGRHGIHWAAQEQHIGVVEFFLESGVDPNLKDDYGISPLDIVASEGGIEIAKMLLDYGANPNIQRKSGSTPLHLACAYGEIEIVKLLIDYGGDPNIRKFEKGNLPVENAREAGFTDIVRLLTNF